jgi:lysophospholipase L1-like esterase
MPPPDAVASPDPVLRYEGRWDIRGGRATTVNSGSRVLMRFTGSEVTARFDITGLTRAPHVVAYVDGRRGKHLVVDRPAIRLTPEGLPAGEHTLMLAVKDVDEREERWRPPFKSALRIEGFELPGGSLEKAPPAPRLRFTFLGDSITQGVSVLCSSSGSDCADGTLDYAWRVADTFRAGLEQVGFGGQGLTDYGGGNVPPARHALGLNFDGSPAGAWDADVVVVNQGSNDAINGASEATIRAAYLDYLRKVRTRYPRAYILALEPFGFWGWGMGHASSAVRGAVEEFRDARTAFVWTRGWLSPGDFTDGLHPSDAGHQRITERLIETISSLTGISPG